MICQNLRKVKNDIGSSDILASGRDFTGVIYGFSPVNYRIGSRSCDCNPPGHYFYPGADPDLCTQGNSNFVNVRFFGRLYVFFFGGFYGASIQDDSGDSSLISFILKDFE
jgi:hypothetical protein